MNKIAAFCIFSLALTFSNVRAEEKKDNSDTVIINATKETKIISSYTDRIFVQPKRISVKPYCRFGMQFLIATLDKSGDDAGSAGLVMLQVMDAGDTTKKVVPMKCAENK